MWRAKARTSRGRISGRPLTADPPGKQGYMTSASLTAGAELDAFEEAEDVAAFDAAMAEGGDSIPWEQIKADLGWS